MYRITFISAGDDPKPVTVTHPTLAVAQLLTDALQQAGFAPRLKDQDGLLITAPRRQETPAIEAPPVRRQGTTSRQMKDAPQLAVFVWCGDDIGYPRRLAVRLGRHDLTIKSLSWLRPEVVVFQRLVGVVIDHAAVLDARSYAAVDLLRQQCFVQAPP